MELSTYPALPKITAVKVGKRYNVDWDHECAPECRVLMGTKRGFLDGYIEGAVAALEIPLKDVVCLASTVGTVKNLDELTANKLVSILTNLLHPIVSAEHQRLTSEAKLTHVQALRNFEQANRA
jgi:hypothetical protein